MINQSDVTIIIPHLGKTLEQERSLSACLQSLVETCESNIILIINGVDDTGPESVLISPNVYELIESGRVKLISLGQQGQCKAVNAAAATVNTKWILVSNDDMIYAPGWFEKLVESTDNDFFLCVSPILIEPQDGAPTFKKFFAGGAGGDFNKEKWLEFANGYQGFGIRTGFNLPFLIRKELWDLVGGYDVNYDPWGSNSDSDLEYKIRLAGVQPYQNTNCPVYHFSQTSGTFEPRNRPSWENNWKYFIDKWGFPRTDDGIWEATFIIPTKEEGRKFFPWWEGFYSK